MATTEFSSWDFYNQHIQQDVFGGQYVAADSTLVAAGPPYLTSNANGNGGGAAVAETASSNVYPIGLLETFGLQQSRQLQRLFEVGSSRSYFIPGRTIGSITLGRTFYFGPSLLRVLYAYYPKGKSPSITLDVGTKATIAGETGTMPHPGAQLTGGAPTAVHDVKSDPGQDYLFINLASDLFAQPTGLAVYFKDQNNTSLAAFYLEFCYVQGHQLSISAGSILVMEGASLQYDRLVPIKMMTGVTTAS